jgi:hypothetical protein
LLNIAFFGGTGNYYVLKRHPNHNYQNFIVKFVYTSFAMDTLTIKIRDSKALKLIHDLESLNLIQVISENGKKPTKKLSEILSGSISEQQADSMHKELQKMRNEWERNI